MLTDALIADRIEIADLHTRFARLLDERRWDEADTVYAEDVEVRSPRIGVRGIAGVVDYMRSAEVAGEFSQHLTTDLGVEVDGDRAVGSANSLVYYFREGEPPHQSSGLRLNFTAVRTSVGWRLREVRVTLAWTRRD